MKLLNLEEKNIKEIEKKCIDEGYLDQNDNLLKIVKNNIYILNEYDLTLEDIKINNDNVFRKIGSPLSTRHDDTVSFYFEDLTSAFEKIYKNHGILCDYYNSFKEFDYNGYKFLILKVSWCGDQHCPIDQYFDSDTKNMQHNIAELFVINLTTKDKMWIPSLSMNQFTKYGFNHSKNSTYYLDIEKYIKLFGLDINKPTLLEMIEVDCWLIKGGGSKSLYDRYETENRVKTNKIIRQDENFIIKIIDDNIYGECLYVCCINEDILEKNHFFIISGKLLHVNKTITDSVDLYKYEDTEYSKEKYLKEDYDIIMKNVIKYD